MPIDPLGVTLAKQIADKSLAAVGHQIGMMLKSAEEAKKEDLSRTLGYLGAARTAVVALHQESQKIFSQAKTCDLDNVVEVKELQERLRRYLHEDNIRPHLIPAVQGLKDCQAMLEKRSHSVWLWPWSSPDKEAAIQEFAKTVKSLVDFVSSLEEQMKFLKSATGPEAERLCQIRDILEEHIAYPGQLISAREQIDKIVKAADADPTHGGWLSFTGEVEHVANRVRDAFY